MPFATNLRFSELRQKNIERGEKDFPQCKDWTPADRMMEFIGELGEAANLLKKVRRGDYELEQVFEKIQDELGDAVITLDLLAASVGVNLGCATVQKFNEVSNRIGSGVRLGELFSWEDGAPNKTVSSMFMDKDDQQSMAENLRCLADRVDRGELVSVGLAGTTSDNSVVIYTHNFEINPSLMVAGLRAIESQAVSSFLGRFEDSSSIDPEF